MKILWLSHFVPFPPRGGNLQRSFNLIRCLSGTHEVVLASLNLSGAPRRDIGEWCRELSQYCSEVQVWDLPFPWKGIRWWEQVLFSPLSAQPFSTEVLWSEKLQQRWWTCLNRHSGAVVHLDSIDLAGYVNAALHSHRVVLNHHNCESAMLQRRSDNTRILPAGWYLKSQAVKMARLEKDLCARVHANIAVCDHDRDLLLAGSPRAHVHVVENGTDADYFQAPGNEEEPKTLLFAGSLRWYPNLSGLRYFRQAIWPIICADKPDVRLYLAGRDPVREILRWAEEDPRITLAPSPADIRPWFRRASVFICPILDGGGTRLKILDALSMGKAVVTTSIGCEGLAVERDKHLIIADRPADFARVCVQLMDHPEYRRRLGAAGRRLVEDRYCWDRIAKHLLDAYACATTGECAAAQASSTPVSPCPYSAR